MALEFCLLAATVAIDLPWSVRLGVVIVMGFACLAVLVFATKTVRDSYSSGRLCLLATGLNLEGPRESVQQVPYTKISGVEQRTRPFRVVALGVLGKMSIGIPGPAFRSPAEARELIGLLGARLRDVHSADEIAAMQERERVGARMATELPLFALAFSAVAIVSFLLQLAVSAADGPRVLALGANSGVKILAGEIYRPFSAALLHVSWLHLGANLVSLALVGLLLEGLVGRLRTGLVLGLSSLLGCLASAAWAPDRYAIGASAGVMGLYGLLAAIVLLRRDQLPASLHLGRSVFLLLLVQYLALEFSVANLDHMGHAGGFAAGLAIGAGLLRGRRLLEHDSPPGLALRAVTGLLALGYLAGSLAIVINATRLGEP